MVPASILAIDPGEHTGWVEFSVKAESAAEITADGLVYPAHYYTVANLYRSFIQRAHHPVLVICENWINIPYAEHAVNPTVVLQQIGVLRQLARDGGVPLVLPPPQARTQVTMETLREAGYFLQGGDYDHVRQATRHGLSWLVSHHHQPTVERLYPRL
jgi:hypothetical protein